MKLHPPKIELSLNNLFSMHIKTLELRMQIAYEDTSKYEDLSDEDYLTIGEYIQNFNHIDISIQTIFLYLQENENVAKIKKMNVSNIISKIKEYVETSSNNPNYIKCYLEALSNIEYFRKIRNIFSHWLGKKIQQDNYLVFFTDNPESFKPSFEEICNLGEHYNLDQPAFIIIEKSVLAEFSTAVAKYNFWLSNVAQNLLSSHLEGKLPIDSFWSKNDVTL